MGVRVEGQGNRVRVKGFGTVMQRSPPISILFINIRAVVKKTSHLCNIIFFNCLQQRHLAPGREGEGLVNNTEESAKTGKREREREREDKTVFETERETRGQDKDRKQQDPRRRQETSATGLSHTHTHKERERERE